MVDRVFLDEWSNNGNLNSGYAMISNAEGTKFGVFDSATETLILPGAVTLNKATALGSANTAIFVKTGKTALGSKGKTTTITIGSSVVGAAGSKIVSFFCNATIGSLGILLNGAAGSATGSKYTFHTRVSKNPTIVQKTPIGSAACGSELSGKNAYYTIIYTA